MADEFDDEPEIDEAVWRPLAASVAGRVEGGETCVVVGTEDWDRLTAAGNPGGSPVPLTRETANEATAFLARTLGGYHEVEACSEVEPDGAGGWRRKEGGAPGPVFVLSGRDKEAVDAWKRARDAEGMVRARSGGATPDADDMTVPPPSRQRFRTPHLLVVHDAPDGVFWEVFNHLPLREIAHWGAWAKNPPGPTQCFGPMGFDDRWRARFVACVHDGLLRAPPGTLRKAMRHHGVLEYRGALPDGPDGGPLGRRRPPDFGYAPERAMRELEATQEERERRLINLETLSWENGRPDPLSGGATLLMTENFSAFLEAAAEWVGYGGPSSWFDDLEVPGCREADPGALARALPVVRADLARLRDFGEPFFSPGLEDNLAGLAGGDRVAARSLALRAAALDRTMSQQGRADGLPSPRALAAACRAPLESRPPLRFHAAGYRARFLAAPG